MIECCGNTIQNQLALQTIWPVVTVMSIAVEKPPRPGALQRLSDTGDRYRFRHGKGVVGEINDCLSYQAIDGFLRLDDLKITASPFAVTRFDLITDSEISIPSHPHRTNVLL